MIVIFANSTKTNMGGVEIFNEEFESLLDKNKLQYFRAYSINTNKIINYIIRILISIYFIIKSYRKVNLILVQYGNFLDILCLPFFWLTFKPVKIIAHVGDSWKHIKNKNMKLVTNFFLKLFVKQVYIITDEQRVFLKHYNIKKVHTLINEQYILQNRIANTNEKYLLFLGRVCIEKGINDLIFTYIELNKKMRLPILNIVGPVEVTYKEKLHNLISENEMDNKIFILNPVYEIEQKIKLIDNAILLIYPSYADAFPLTVIESFARGTSCLATSISETKNFIEFKEFLFTPGSINELKNKLEYILLNKASLKEKTKQMQKKSIKYAEGQIINDIFQKGDVING